MADVTKEVLQELIEELKRSGTLCYGMDDLLAKLDAEPPKRRMMANPHYPLTDHGKEHDELIDCGKQVPCHPVTTPSPADSPKQDAPSQPRAWVCIEDPNGESTLEGDDGSVSVIVRPLPTAEGLGQAVIDESKRIVFSEDNVVDHAWRNRIGAAILRALGVSK